MTDSYGSPGTRDEVMITYIGRNGQLRFIKFDDGSYGIIPIRAQIIIIVVIESDPMEYLAYTIFCMEVPTENFALRTRIGMMILHGIYGQKEILIMTVVGMSTIPTV